MDSLVYRHERLLGRITLVLGLLAWLLIIVGTVGIALVYLLAIFIGYVFAHSGVIAYLKGTAVRITEAQMPDLHAQMVACCRKLDIAEVPEAYLLQGDGMLNAFATRFLGRNFVILLSDVVDAMDEHPDGIHFYIGHELGHIRMKHLTGHLWRAPVLWLPLLGAAYARAKESTCDLHGRACCESPESAARAMAALAAGPKRWRSTDLVEYTRQCLHNTGFWSSFHELIGGYPWLTKRVARVLKPEIKLPARNPLAYVLALFVPYAGRAGGAFAGMLVVVAMIGVLAAVALPAYQQYQQRAVVSSAWTQGATVRAALAAHYQRTQQAPETLEAVGVADTLGDGSELTYDAETMAIDVVLPGGGVLRMEPSIADTGATVQWRCVAGDGVKAEALPPSCREAKVL